MNQAIRIAACTLALAVLVGCGKGDPTAEANKNLKAVDPKAPPPTAASSGVGGGAATPAKKDDGPAASAAPVM